MLPAQLLDPLSDEAAAELDKRLESVSVLLTRWLDLLREGNIEILPGVTGRPLLISSLLRASRLLSGSWLPLRASRLAPGGLSLV